MRCSSLKVIKLSYLIDNNSATVILNVRTYHLNCNHFEMIVCNYSWMRVQSSAMRYPRNTKLYKFDFRQCVKFVTNYT